MDMHILRPRKERVKRKQSLHSRFAKREEDHALKPKRSSA